MSVNGKEYEDQWTLNDNLEEYDDGREKKGTIDIENSEREQSEM